MHIHIYVFFIQKYIIYDTKGIMPSISIILQKDIFFMTIVKILRVALISAVAKQSVLEIIKIVIDGRTVTFT